MSPLDVAISRFGGDEMWQRLSCVTLRVVELSGPLPWMKGQGRTFKVPGVVRIYPRRFRAEFEGLGTFEAGSVDGRADYRRTFDGLRKNRRWSNSDAAYFFGYALTTYLSVPFLLRELPTRIVERSEGFEVMAEFPERIHTHSARQRFVFARDGLLVRHDYVADIVGWWAAGAHFTSDYVTVKGLPIATRRQVFARLGRASTPLPVLSATIEPVDVE